MKENNGTIAANVPFRLDNPRAWRTYLGGRQLDALHGIPDGIDGHFPEEWILSVVSARNVGREGLEEGMSHLYGTKRSLKEILEQNPQKLLGKKHADAYGSSPGVLTKLIDSAERLTLQVHPDRQKAMELFNSPFGKTECWHILGGHETAGEKPCIYLGFKPGITKEYWKHLFEIQDIPGMLAAMQKFEVHPGDTILIEGGMPHAIGAGCFLAEIQEPTDYTIRVERTTPSGFPVDDFLCHQGLGFERMFDAFHYNCGTREEIQKRFFIQPTLLSQQDGGTITTLIGYKTTPLFRLDELQITKTLTIPSHDSFSGLYILEGHGILHANGASCPLEKTAQFFIPAETGTYTIEAQSETPMHILRFFGASI